MEPNRCLHCGGHATVSQEVTTEGKIVFRIICKECGIATPLCSTLVEALSKWDARYEESK